MTGQQLLNKILPRIAAAPPQTMSFVNAVNDVLETIGSLLLAKGSSLLKTYDSVTYTAGNSTAPLPEEFWGFIDAPYISDPVIGIKELTPVVSVSAYDKGNTGTPSEFEIYAGDGGDNLVVYPIPAADITIKFAYNKKPYISVLGDTLPCNGLFDTIIGDILIRSGNSGGWTTATSDWSYIDDRVSTILLSRTPKKMKLLNVRSVWA